MSRPESARDTAQSMTPLQLARLFMESWGPLTTSCGRPDFLKDLAGFEAAVRADERARGRAVCPDQENDPR